MNRMPYLCLFLNQSYLYTRDLTFLRYIILCILKTAIFKIKNSKTYFGIVFTGLIVFPLESDFLIKKHVMNGKENKVQHCIFIYFSTRILEG